jgi:hypothetical protein
MFYEIDFWLLKFKSPLLKPKLNLLNYIFFWILQHSYKSFNKHLPNEHDINVVLHTCVWQNWSFDMVFGSFDYDHT